MQIRYTGPEGKDVTMKLGMDTVVIGRATDSDVVLDDAKTSRHHCELRFWAGDYVIKDLNSQNGTYINGKRIDATQLYTGDQITVGSTLFYFEDKTPSGASTALRMIENKMSQGKGYKTILREILRDADGNPLPGNPPQ